MEEHAFTCNTCGLSFAAADYQREHMKTDWHRYNLKRRVAELPPIPADIFAEKMFQQRSVALNPDSKDHSRRQVTKKDMKRMEKQRQAAAAAASQSDGTSSAGHSRASSVVSGVSHLSLGDSSHEFASEGFSEAENEPETDTEQERNGDEVDELLREKLAKMVKIPPNVCFMDGKPFASVEENLAYLETRYGLVVPESRHLADPEGLVTYLNEKVGLGNCCLSCNYMGRSLAAVRAHMVDKQHVKIPLDTEEQRDEIADFYGAESDVEWEDLSGSEEDISDDEQGELVQKSSSDHEAPENEPYVAGYELVLGSGRSAGHRSLQRYYKQRLSAAPEPQGRKAVRLIDNRSPGVSDRAANNMIKQEFASQKRAGGARARGRKHQNFQQHFRDPLLQ